MKKTISPIIITGLIALTMSIGCKSSADKVLDAKENLVDAKTELNQARKDSILQFKEESHKKISHYEKAIAEFKAGIVSEKKEIKDKYEIKLAALEQKNKEMKTKLTDFKEEGVDEWDSFKTEFNHDMDEFGKAFDDLTVNNTK